MPDAPEILILSSCSDQVANLTFLLHLANYHTIQIRDSSETFNYLVQRQRRRQPIKLLLIAGAAQQQQFLQMLDELDRCGAMLPILLIYDNQPVQLELIGCSERRKRYISQCRAEMTHASIKQILFTDSLTLEQRA